jgi:hypothetical protein
MTKQIASQQTFIMDGVPPHHLPGLKALAVASLYEHHNGRVILVAESIPKALKKFLVRVVDGDLFSVMRPWTQQNVIDGFHGEYLQNAPVPALKQKSALVAWAKARDKLAAREMAFEKWRLARKTQKDLLVAAIEEAKQAEHVASADLVRTHGKGPINHEGITWFPNQSCGRCYMVPNRQKEVKKNDVG